MRRAFATVLPFSANDNVFDDFAQKDWVLKFKADRSRHFGVSTKYGKFIK